MLLTVVAAAAAADARSVLRPVLPPVVILPSTLDAVPAFVMLLEAFLEAAGIPLVSAVAVECLFATGLLGELLRPSLGFIATPFFRAVVGGSGSGRTAVEGVCNELKRLIGEVLIPVVACGIGRKLRAGFGLRPVINSW